MINRYGLYAEQRIWNAAIEAAALVVEPNPNKEEERECQDVAGEIRSLKKYGEILLACTSCGAIDPPNPLGGVGLKS